MVDWVPAYLQRPSPGQLPQGCRRQAQSTPHCSEHFQDAQRVHSTMRMQARQGQQPLPPPASNVWTTRRLPPGRAAETTPPAWLHWAHSPQQPRIAAAAPLLAKAPTCRVGPNRQPAPVARNCGQRSATMSSTIPGSMYVGPDSCSTCPMSDGEGEREKEGEGRLAGNALALSARRWQPSDPARPPSHPCGARRLQRVRLD